MSGLNMWHVTCLVDAGAEPSGSALSIGTLDPYLHAAGEAYFTSF
jgi:hypothetical protein